MYFKNVMMSYTHVCWSFSQQMAFSHLVHNHTASLHFNESPSSCHVSLPFFFLVMFWGLCWLVFANNTN